MTKIATWNVNSLRVRLPHVLDWLATEQPDILALQETKVVDEVFPQAEIEAVGYQVIFSGQKTYNGVAVLSKASANDIETDISDLDDPQRRILVSTIEGLRIVNIYVPNGRTVDSDPYRYKLDWLDKMTCYLREQIAIYPRLIVLGDYNIAPDDRDVHDPEKWQGLVLCSDAEREAFNGMLNLGLSDTYRLVEHEQKQYSWWDYRMHGFRRNLGMRIDHILASQQLCAANMKCWIDKDPRKWERPSDHTPVVASFDD